MIVMGMKDSFIHHKSHQSWPLGNLCSIFTNSGYKLHNAVRSSGESEYIVSVIFPLEFLIDAIITCAVCFNSSCYCITIYTYPEVNQEIGQNFQIT